MLPPRYYYEHIFDEFETLITQSAIRHGIYHAGESLHSIGDALTELYYVKSGMLNVMMVSSNGEPCTLSYFGPGSMHPCKCRQFNFSLEFTFSINAVLDSEVYILTPQILTELILAHPQIAVAALDFHVLYSNLLSYRILTQSYESSEKQVCNFLYLYATYAPEHAHYINLTQDDVAATVGLSRIQVARVYQTLRKNGVIETFRSMIHIRDMEKLKQMGSDGIVEA